MQSNDSGDQETMNAVMKRGLGALQNIAPSGSVAYYTPYDNVAMFHAAAGGEGCYILGRPLERISSDIIEAKQKHIREKFEEAMLSLDSIRKMGVISPLQVAEALNNLVDVDYYVKSICIVLGLPFDTAFTIVHQANIKKLMVKEPKFRVDGRVEKPEGWESPTKALQQLVELAASEVRQAQSKANGIFQEKPRR